VNIDNNQVEPNVVQPGGARNRNIRNRFNNPVRNENVEPNEEEEEEEKEDQEENALVDPSSNKKLVQKEAKRQEKKERNEAMKATWELKGKKEDDRRKKNDELEKKREEDALKEEEVLAQLREEERKREEEEYIKWKDTMIVEEAGTEADQMENEGNLLQKFVDYIKLRKVVVLDDLAAEFKLNSKDAISRIKSLEASKVLNGVIDDRGKYIYITDQEFDEIANYIKKRGRVSRADLLIECNKVIKLNPSEKDKERILQEESKLLDELESDFKNMEDQLSSEKSPTVVVANA